MVGKLTSLVSNFVEDRQVSATPAKYKLRKSSQSSTEDVYSQDANELKQVSNLSSTKLSPQQCDKIAKRPKDPIIPNECSLPEGSYVVDNNDNKECSRRASKRLNGVNCDGKLFKTPHKNGVVACLSPTRATSPFECACVKLSPSPERKRLRLTPSPAKVASPPKNNNEERRQPDPSDNHSAKLERCLWQGCKWTSGLQSGTLLHHLNEQHVGTQLLRNGKIFRCMWRDCKYFGTSSTTRSWLERHVRCHAGSKPYRCIFDGCKQRFSSEFLLERHVNTHLRPPMSSSSTPSTAGSVTSRASKNGESQGFHGMTTQQKKRMRFTRILAKKANSHDFLDDYALQQIGKSLLNNRYNVGTEFRAKILAKRRDKCGSEFYLVAWQPENYIPTEWISASEFVPIRSLPSWKLRQLNGS